MIQRIFSLFRQLPGLTIEAAQEAMQAAVDADIDIFWDEDSNKLSFYSLSLL